MALNTVAIVVMVTGYAPNAAGAPYTVGANKKALIKDIWLSNTDTVAHTITVRVTPSGQSTSDAYAILKGAPLGPAGTAESSMQIPCSTPMMAGDFIDVIADVASKVAVRIGGVEVS